MSVIECATVNEVTIADERHETPERDHQAQQEQQVVGCRRGCARTRRRRSAAPPGASADRAAPGPGRRGIRRRAPRLPAAGSAAPPCTCMPRRSSLGPDREFRALRADRILEQHVEQPLLPENLRWPCGSRGSGDVRERRARRRGTSVSESSDTRASTMRGRGETHVAFVELDVVGEPQRRRVAQRGIDAREVDETADRAADSRRRASP